MTSLILTLRQDPTALVECFAAAITALYLLRLSFQSGLEACEGDSAKLSFPAPPPNSGRDWSR